MRNLEHKQDRTGSRKNDDHLLFSLPVPLDISGPAPSFTSLASDPVHIIVPDY